MNDWADISLYITDALVIAGVFVMTAGVYGLVRMPDIYGKVHAASKAVFLGAIVLMIASVATGEREIILRVVLIGAALMITTPISSHVIIKAAAERGELFRSSSAINESDFDLNIAGQADRT